jgi:urease subunit beta
VNLVPGEIKAAAGEHHLLQDRERRELRVINGGDRPVQVGSHFHFADVNSALEFDRESARGFRLAIPAGTSVRFEPGVSVEVELIALGGAAKVPGLQVSR